MWQIYLNPQGQNIGVCGFQPSSGMGRLGGRWMGTRLRSFDGRLCNLQLLILLFDHTTFEEQNGVMVYCQIQWLQGNFEVFSILIKARWSWQFPKVLSWTWLILCQVTKRPKFCGWFHKPLLNKNHGNPSGNDWKWMTELQNDLSTKWIGQLTSRLISMSIDMLHQ